MLTWISEQAKWIVYTFIVAIVAGLLFMDLSGLQTSNQTEIGSVNGEKLSNELFDMQVRQIQEQRSRAGQSLSSQELAQLRKDIFDAMVRRTVLEKKMSELNIEASSREMFHDLLTSPPAGIMQAPQFMTDSVFDRTKYEAWLATDSIYDTPSMMQYEQSLRLEKIPFKQLQLLLGAGLHGTDLEAKFQVMRRENKGRFRSLRVPLDSIPADLKSISEKEIQEYFAAHPDSFRVEKDMKKIRYVSLPIIPSANDDSNTLKYAQMIHRQLKDGADFAELAKLNSEDGSAAEGGSLGGFQARGTWVKPFEEAAFALDSGEMSEPVKTRFGYHILLSEGKMMQDTVEKVNIRHILLKVTPSPETVDSLRGVLEDLREVALEKNLTLAEAVQDSAMKLKESSYFARGEVLPELGGYLSGLSSYSFASVPGQEKEAISPVMQNDAYVVLAELSDSLTAGEPLLEPNVEDIKLALVRQKKLEEAQKILKDALNNIPEQVDSVWASAHAKVLLDSTQFIGADSYVPGLGYAHPAVWKLIQGDKGKWSEPLDGDRAVVSMKLLEEKLITVAQAESMIPREAAQVVQVNPTNLLNTWVEGLVEDADVESNLDLYFSE